MPDSGKIDLLVAGGGINGAGIARDAPGRGLDVALCEQGDPGDFTSSASTRLIHGGLRYLEYYEFGLVRKALMLTFADRIVVMSDGEVVQLGTPRELWWQNVADAVTGGETPQGAMDNLVKEQDRVMQRLERAGAQERCGPKLNERREAQYGFDQPGAPKPEPATRSPRTRPWPTTS